MAGFEKHFPIETETISISVFFHFILGMDWIESAESINLSVMSGSLWPQGL